MGITVPKRETRYRVKVMYTNSPLYSKPSRGGGEGVAIEYIYVESLVKKHVFVKLNQKYEDHLSLCTTPVCGRETSFSGFGYDSKSSDFLCPNNLSSLISCMLNASCLQDECMRVVPGYCAAFEGNKKQLIAACCPYVFPQHMMHNTLLQLPADIVHLDATLCGNLHRGSA